MARTFLLLAVLILATGCGGSPTEPTADSPTNTPALTGIPGPRDTIMTPIAPPPQWITPVAIITRDNAHQWQLLGRLDAPGTPSTFFSSAYSPDGTRLAALNNSLLLAWDMITGETVLNNTRLSGIRLYYSPDKSELFVVNDAGGTLIYDAERGNNLNNFLGHPQFNGVADYDNLNGWLALGGTDGEIRIWDTLERVALATIPAHQGEVFALRFSPDGELLASSGADNLVYVWRWRNREMIAMLSNSGAVPFLFTFSPDGSRLAVSTNEVVNVFQATDGTYLYTLQTGLGAANNVLFYSPDGRYLVNGGSGPDMMVWDGTSGEFIAFLPEASGERLSAAFSADGQLLLTSTVGGPVALWDMTQITNETVSRAELNPGTDQVVNVAWSPDGYTVLFFDAAGPIYVWGIGEQTAGD